MVKERNDVMTIGKIIMYSLSSNVNINLEEMEDKARELDIPIDLLPTTDDVNIKRIRKMLEKTFRLCYSVKIRKNGGAVFIPRQYIHCWYKIKELLLSMDALKDVVEIFVSDNDRDIIFDIIEEEMEVFFDKETSPFKDSNGRIGLPHGRIDALYCANARICEARKKAEIYSTALGLEMGVYGKKVVSLCGWIKKGIENRIEEIEEDSLYD